MYKIEKHPILVIPPSDPVVFKYEGRTVTGQRGKTIAAALHQAGFPIHSHSIDDRNRSLECGIGKCGACEMLVDGKIRRICITKVDGVKEVREIPKDYLPEPEDHPQKEVKIHKTTVAIIGAGPAGGFHQPPSTRILYPENAFSTNAFDRTRIKRICRNSCRKIE